MTVEFHVALTPPLDMAGSLELFRRSGDDLIDRWDGRRLIRAVPCAGAWMPFVATATGCLDRPGFDVVVGEREHVEPVRAVVARTFVEAPDGYADLVNTDTVVAALDRQHPGIRQIRQLDVFTALIRCISAQQVNLRWAVITRRRLAEAFGRAYEIAANPVYALDPSTIADLDPVRIRELQFTMSKSVSIVATARAVINGGMDARDLADLSDHEVIEKLVAIRGIGRWSAEWVLARTLGRPRVVAGDLGVRKAVGLAYLGTPAPSEAQVREATAHWGAAAGAAQALLLHALAEGVITSPARPESRVASRR